MKHSLHKPVVFLSITAVAILIAVQVYWFQGARKLKDEQFDGRVNLALRSVADNLLFANSEPSGQLLPVRKTASNRFYVPIGTFIRYMSLDSILRKEFAEAHINTAFNLMLYSESDSLILGNFYEKGAVGSDDASCIGRDQVRSKMNFAVEFPEKDAEILATMDLWVFSAGIFALVIAMLGLLTLNILRQKKIATMKNDFISNMTHELQTPISNIALASDVLRMNPAMEDEKKGKYLDIISRENLRLKKQVELVLQTASLEEDHLDLKNQPVDLHQLLAEVIERFRLRMEQRRGYIQSKLVAKQPVVNGDPAHLSNLFYNLLDNAEKYTHGIPAIDVTSENTTEGIAVRIADNGIGMNGDTQKLVFEKFYRASNGNRHDVKGFGLGLAYVKKIVEAHSGVINVQSQLNAGSCFTVILPTTALQ